MYIALTSDSVTPGQLYEYASTQVGQRLSILPGVSQVLVFGTKSAIRIKADPSAMWARGISIDDLNAAIKSGTSYTGAGQLDSKSGTAILRPQGQLETADQYLNLIVGGTRAAPVYLRDVAKVEDSVQDERVNMRFWVRGYSVAVSDCHRGGQSPRRRQRSGSVPKHPRNDAGDQRTSFQARFASLRSTIARSPSCTLSATCEQRCSSPSCWW